MLLLTILGTAHQLNAANLAEQYRFDIPATDVRSALGQVAKHTQLQLVFSSELVNKIQSNAVKGRYSAAIVCVERRAFH